MLNWKDFLLKEKENQDLLITRKMYVVITGDLITAHLLSKIIYWFLPGKSGKKKTRVEREGKDWLAKKRTDWWKECCVTEFQVDRAIKRLKELGFIETKIFRWYGDPITHISLDKEKLLKAVNDYYKTLDCEEEETND